MTIENQSVVDPELKDVLDDEKRALFLTLNCVKIGSVQKVDGTRKTLEVQVSFKRQTGSGQIKSFPLLVDVPFVTIQGGGTAVQVPVSVGDDCLVFFSDRNIDSWFKAGGQALPFDGRAHDASDAIALVGVNALTSALIANPTDEGRIISGTTKVGVMKDGSRAFIVQGAAEVSVEDNLVRIKSAATDLLTVLEGLIDVIKAVSTVPGGGPLNAGSIAALEAYKLILQGLLTT